MKIMILGNSHQVCIKKALDQSPADKLEFHFVQILPRALELSLRIMDGQLVPVSDAVVIKSDGDISDKRTVKLDGYDAIFVSALGTAVPRPENPTAIGNLVRHAGFASGSSVGPPVVSETVFVAMLEAAIVARMLVKLVNELRTTTNRPVFFLQWPLPCLDALSLGTSNFQRFYGASAEEALRWYGQTTVKLAWEAESQFSEGVRLLNTIPADWVAEGLSPTEFSDRDDPWHLNAAYGKMVLDGIREAMRA